MMKALQFTCAIALCGALMCNAGVAAESAQGASAMAAGDSKSIGSTSGSTGSNVARSSGTREVERVGAAGNANRASHRSPTPASAGGGRAVTPSRGGVVIPPSARQSHGRGNAEALRSVMKPRSRGYLAGRTSDFRRAGAGGPGSDSPARPQHGAATRDGSSSVAANARAGAATFSPGGAAAATSSRSQAAYANSPRNLKGAIGGSAAPSRGVIGGPISGRTVSNATINGSTARRRF